MPAQQTVAVPAGKPLPVTLTPAAKVGGVHRVTSFEVEDTVLTPVAERLLYDGQRYAEAWNFGPDEQDCVSVENVVTEFARLWDPPARWEADGAVHPPEAHFLHLDSGKARSRLGWRPRLGLHRALEWTVDWYREHERGAEPTDLTTRQIERYLQLVSA